MWTESLRVECPLQQTVGFDLQFINESRLTPRPLICCFCARAT